MEGPVTRIQAGGCCRAVGTGLDYPHTLSAAVRVVWGRSPPQRHLTGPLTGTCRLRRTFITGVPVHRSGRRVAGTAGQTRTRGPC